MPFSKSLVIQKLCLALLVLCVLFTFSTCDSPLVGLGGKVDLSVPQIRSLSVANGDYLKGTVTLTGTMDDDIGVSSVKLTLTQNGNVATSLTGVKIENSVADINATKSEWNLTLDTSIFADGEYTCIIQISDSSAKITEKQVLLFFDNKAPTVMIKTLDPEYGLISIKGEASDLFGIKTVQVKVYSPDGTVWASTGDIGTNTFAVLFDSKLDGNHEIEVIATDKAGNTNDHYYKYSDILVLSSGIPVTIEELHKIELGLITTPVDVSAVKKSTLKDIAYRHTATIDDPIKRLIHVLDQSLNLPVIMLSNPDPTGDYTSNLLAPNANILLTISDPDGIKLDSILLRITNYNTGAVVQDWISPTTKTGSTSVRVQQALGSGVGGIVLVPGPYKIEFEARDSGGNKRTSSPVSFSIDAGIPDVSITSPLAGEYKNSRTVTVTGTAIPVAPNTISTSPGSILLSIDNGQTWPIDASSTYNSVGNTWSKAITFPYDGVNILDGLKTLKVKVIDSSSKTGTFNIQFFVDGEAPSTTFLSPTKGATVNNYITLRGNANDNIGMAKVELKIGKTNLGSGYVELADRYSWTSLAFNTSDYTNALEAYESAPNSNIWYLPVQVRVTDLAGNVTETLAYDPVTNKNEYYLLLDPESDKPKTTIIYPQTAARIGGSLRFAGSAYDDDAVHHLEMQLVALKPDGFLLDSPYRALDGSASTEAIWIPVSGTSQWKIDLNLTGALYDVDGAGVHAGDFLLRVRSVDTKDGSTADISGDVEEIKIRFDDTIPRIENLNFIDNDYTKGTFTLTGNATDNDSVSQIRVSFDSGATWPYSWIPGDGDVNASVPASVTGTTIAGGANYSFTRDVTNPLTKVAFSLPFDTTKLWAANNSGFIFVKIRVIDGTNYQIDKTITLYADNKYPTIGISGTNLTDMKTSTAEIRGICADTGTGGTVEQVEIYFIRTQADGNVGKLYSVVDGATANPIDIDFGNGQGSVKYTSNNNYKITITRSNTDLVNGKEIKAAGSGYDWWAKFDSTKLDDGSYDVYAVTVDKAGNTTFAKNSTVFINNNPPVISSIIAGTDLNGNGDTLGVSPSERKTFDSITVGLKYTDAANFRIRNKRLYFKINEESNSKNKPYTYSITVSGDSTNYAGNTSWYGTISQYEAILGDTSGLLPASIAFPASLTDGTKEFTFTITNSVGKSVSQLMSVNLQNVDAVASSISVADFGKSPSGAVISYADNIVSSSGHIEVAGVVSGTDPDVSGKIRIKGKASDNQRLQNITATIPGFDPDGAGAALAGSEFIIASWDTGTSALLATTSYNSAVWNLGIAGGTQALDETTGHTLEWNFELDTAMVSGVATLDKVITFKSYDFGTSAAASSTMTVDIVPYITSIVLKAPYIRDTLGRYPFYQGDTLVEVNGYNLGNSAKVGGTVDTSTVVLTGGTAMTSLGAASLPNQLTMTIPTSLAEGAGDFTVVTNSIASINNFTLNTLASNIESTLTDDRVIYIDDIDPTIEVAPFGKKYPSKDNNTDKVLENISLYTDNIKLSGTDKLGHIEYTIDSLFDNGATNNDGVADDADVSGEVVFKGKVYDNQRINRITAKIIGYNSDAEFDIYTLAGGGITGADWAMGVDGGTQYKITDRTATNTELAKGHILNFSFTFNTAKIATIAANNVSVEFKVYDANNLPQSTISTMSIDVVPYINSIMSLISGNAGSDFARSAKGVYPVYNGESITINGFNLNGTSTIVTAGAVGMTATAGTNSSVTVTVGGSVISSSLGLTVNSVPSLNNTNKNPQFDTDGQTILAYAYNSQANGTNNNRLDDDVSLSVWDLGSFVNATNITSPVMKMNSAGDWFMSYGNGVPSMAVNKNGTETSVDWSYNKFQNTTVGFDGSGNIYAVGTNTDRIGNDSAKYSFYSRAVLRDSGDGSYQSAWTGKGLLETVYNTATTVYDINRVPSPKMYVTGTTAATKVYMSYFDKNHTKNPVKFRYGTVDNTNTFGDGFSANIADTTEGYANNTVSTGSAANYHVVASNDAAMTYNGGLYSAVGATSDGIAVVAWYDASARKLMYSYNTTPATPVVGGVWQTNAKVIDSSYAGWYVDLTVDAANGIHIAYYNSAKGDLKYAYLPSYNCTAGEISVVTVDSYLSVGTQITIATREETIDTVSRNVPYITYFYPSFTQTPSSVRVAWRTDWASLRDGVVSDKYTGAWEAMTIPTTSTPSDSIVCSGLPTSGTYANKVVLGYMTDSRYERAVKK